MCRQEIWMQDGGVGAHTHAPLYGHARSRAPTHARVVRTGLNSERVKSRQQNKDRIPKFLPEKSNNQQNVSSEYSGF